MSTTADPPEGELAARFERWGRWMALGVSSWGLLVLLLWRAGLADQLRVGGRPAMRPGGAICFVLLGLAARFSLRPRLRRALAGLALLLSLVALVELLSSGALGIDAYMTNVLQRYSAQRLQVSFPAAFACTCLACALLLLDLPRGARLCQSLALGGAALGLLAFLEWLYAVDEMQWRLPLATTSPISAICLMLVGGALLFSRPRLGFMALVSAPTFSGALLRRRVPAMVLIPVLTGWLMDLSVGGGLFDRGFALAFFTLGASALTVLLVWRTAASVAATEQATRVNRAELEVREEDLGLTLNSIGDALIAGDLEGRVTRMNPVAEQLTGWTGAEAKGRPLGDVFRTASLQGEDSAERGLHTTRLQSRDGSVRPVSEVHAPIRDGQGAPRGQVVVFRDASSIVAAHRALGEQAREQAILAEASRSFSESGHDVRPLTDAIARQLGDVFGGLCLVRIFSKDAAWVLFDESAAFHPDPEIATRFAESNLPPRSAEEPGLMREVLLNGTAERYGEDLLTMVERARPGLGALLVRAKLESALGLPIRSRDRLLGSVIIARAGGAWSAPDRRLAEGIVGRAGVVLENALLLRDLGKRLWQLDQANARFAALVESAPDAIVMVDEVGVIAVVNAEAETMFGYTRAELIGMRIDELLPERYRPGHAGMRAGYVANPHVRHAMAQGQELFGRRRDGAEFAAEISLSPVEVPGGRHIAALIRDVTDRKRIEELRRRAQELEVETRRAVEANRLKSEFLANMSHELRTPLNAIIGFSALMEAGKAGPLSGPQKEYLGDVLSSARHLLQLINDVIELAKIESGKIEPRPEAVDPSRLSRDVRDVLRGVANTRQVHVEVHVDAALERVVVDARLFKQVLYHYLASALGFSPEGSRVSMRLEAVDERWFRFAVQDAGPGIKPEDLPRIFTEFQQLDVDVAKKFVSTGLGLALAKRIVEAHGGTVAVQSELGVGTTLLATLPRGLPS